ncbi:calmodulin [Clonorchis sinensis]|uniref:Calmodulin n=1 Tax=Clonorchis sinensis TaxID=79923 RepID=H2KRT1_CLOSI|nr:calmodulin [Clonorchis sinensis]
MPPLGCTSCGLKRFFTMLDTDGDKKITFDELKNGLHMFGFTEDNVKQFLDKLDVNKDGTVTYDEYKKVFEIEENQDKDSESDKRTQILLQLFKKLDANHDGKINQEEWDKGMKSMQICEKFSAKLRNYLDVSCDGVITKQEFMVGLGMVEDPIDWRKVFEALDKDKSGDISVEELKAVFDDLGIPILSSGIVEWITQYDTNKDGKLDYSEFLAFAKAQESRAE